MRRAAMDQQELLDAIKLVGEKITVADDGTYNRAIKLCREWGLSGLEPSATAGRLISDPLASIERHVRWLKAQHLAHVAEAEAREAVIAALKQRMVTGGGAE